MDVVRKTIGGLGNLMFKQAYIVSQWADHEIPDIYLQNEKYFNRHADLIRGMYGQNIGRTDATAIHIRRGDYLDAEHFHVNLWKTDYYQKAIAVFPSERFIVFCKDNQDPARDAEDRQWCTDNLTPLVGKFEFAPEDTETNNLNLMASCKNIIMANSSFSWWAAWLNPNSDKRIVCPSQWFSDGIQRVGLLDSWIKI